MSLPALLCYSVCQGRKWECTKNLCDGTCTAIGTAHYLTFDGLKYKFPGNCQYVLAQVRACQMLKLPDQIKAYSGDKPSVWINHS